MAHTRFILEIAKVLSEDDTHRIKRDCEVVSKAHDLELSIDILESSFTAKIKQDDSCESPRSSDNADVMWIKHSRYSLGDEDALDPFYEDDDGNRLLREDTAYILPIYMYDHSGITISHGAFSCQWDSGQVGWHYVTKKSLDEEWGGDLEKAKAYMKATLEEYDQYVQGNCWGFTIEDEEGDDINSCWGFIGDSLEDTGMLDNVEDEHKEALKQAWEDRFE